MEKKRYIYMQRNIVITLILLLLSINVLFSQTTATSSFTVSGTVLDEDKEPMAGASVFFKDRTGGVLTDVDGKFIIKANRGDKLVISMIGYETYEYLVLEDKEKLVVTLKPAATMLEEAVVTGLGVVQSKASIASAVTTVDVGLLQTPATSISNMLGGRVPGVITRRNSGEPGKNVSEFWIRGIGTFGAGASSLVLIDGVEGNMDTIDPADLENVTILKDASATAVYGVRGANGVILITTKKGKAGKLSINARANWTISYLNRMPDYLGSYDYATLANEARAVRGDDPIYDESELYIIKHKLDKDLYPDTNWRDVILNNHSLQQTYYLNMRGGGTLANYFVSLGMIDEGSAYKQDKNSKYRTGVGYSRYNYRANVEMNLTTTTSIDFRTDGSYETTTHPGTGGGTKELWLTQLRLTPLQLPVMYSNGLFPGRSGSEAEFSPFVMLNHTGQKKYEKNNNRINIILKQKLDFITKGLNFEANGTLRQYNEYDETRSMMPDIYRAVGRDYRTGDLKMERVKDKRSVSYSNWQRQERTLTFESRVRYSRRFGSDHGVMFTGAYKMEDRKETRQDEKNTLNALPYRYQEMALVGTYDYKQTYYINPSVGYSGSANFQKGRRFGTFPSIAVAWVPTGYDLIAEKLPWIDRFKLKASYGLSGNDRISNTRFPYLNTVNENATTGWGFGASGIYEHFGADNLKWEKAKQANVGIEVDLFKQRLHIEADMYRDQRDGIFQQRVQIPEYVGLNNMPYGNVGKMKSWGTEAAVSYIHRINEDMDVVFRGSFTYAANKVQNWERAYDLYPYQSWSGWQYGVHRGHVALGLFKDEADVANSPFQDTGSKVMPGDIKYKDINGDGIINSDDEVPISYSDVPRLRYGFGTEFRYKQFTLQVRFDGAGRTDFSYSRKDRWGLGYIPFERGEFGNVLKFVNKESNRWTPASYSGNPATENPNAIFPRMAYGGNHNNNRFSTFWMGDARYLRLSEVNLSYALRHKVLQVMGVSRVDIQLVGTDLCTWDKVGLWDPEIARFVGEEYPIASRVALQLYVYF